MMTPTSPRLRRLRVLCEVVLDLLLRPLAFAPLLFIRTNEISPESLSSLRSFCLQSASSPTFVNSCLRLRSVCVLI
jgi:hypothetical protein